MSSQRGMGQALVFGATVNQRARSYGNKKNRPGIGHGTTEADRAEDVIVDRACCRGELWLGESH